MKALDGASPVSAGIHEPPAWQMVTGYDLDNLTWCELGGRGATRNPPTVHPLDLRPLVPSEHHAELAQLVDDARAAVPLRDDNGAITGAWPMGLLRRAMLQAGSRAGLADPTVAVEATVDELVALVEGGGGPTADDLNERRRDRQRRSALDAPLALGPEFAIPPLSALPRALALMGAAQLATADNMMGASRAVGVGTAPHTGRALVVDDPGQALDLIEPGDVVITRFTSPSWNSILVHAGAIVTTTGGLVSHAAVLARELGIPAVVGDVSAFDRLTTGMIVTVDPANAVVSLVVSLVVSEVSEVVTR
jgi:pyruvate,water dikinase